MLWATAANDSALCKERMAKYGSYIGTAFVARDLMSVVDALGEDGMLRYWGKHISHTYFLPAQRELIRY